MIARVPWAFLFLVVALVPASAWSAPERPGERTYRQKCASCHGANGEGSEDYPRELAGGRSIGQLSRLIAKTMPEDEPGTCVGKEADEVAAFIHEAFYSKTARERNKPPRVELSRLTVRQYRNALTDLIGTFRGNGQWGDRRGLKAEYFSGPFFRGDKRLVERTDAQVDFEFGHGAPSWNRGILDPREFAIRWEGAVLAPETGEYEFVVRTDQAARLWVNDPQRPLVDAWVKSGDDTEHKASITLLGGRAYYLRLEFSKAKQGVRDRKDRNKPPGHASVFLEWTRPQRSPEVVPERYLGPVWMPEAYVATTPFPPDDRSVGYERGTTISKAWDQATTEAAIETADYVARRIRDLTGAGEGDGDREKKLRAFAARFVERAFCRPLDEATRRTYVDRQFEGGRDPQAAVKRVVLLALKSPRFLYQGLGGGPEPYEVATRLSFGLWDSLPDQALLEAAASGRLKTRDEIVRQAERMLPDLRTRSKLREFFLQWLKVEQVPDIAKDPKLYPEFTKEAASDLRTSLELFLDDLITSDAPDFRRLLLEDEVYLNARLAQIYGAQVPADGGFHKVKLEPSERAGLLSHPYLMATFAYTGTSSPIHRGVFIARGLLGRGLRPPPEAVAPLAPDLHPSLTTRDRVTLQTSPAACVTCHGMINPLGFGLEHFDAIGRYRREEKGRPVNATGSYDPPAGEPVKYNGARELATILAASEESQGAFVEQLFHALVKQPVRAYGPRTHAELRRSFAEHDCNIRRLMVEIMATAASPRAELLTKK